MPYEPKKDLDFQKGNSKVIRKQRVDYLGVFRKTMKVFDDTIVLKQIGRLGEMVEETQVFMNQLQDSYPDDMAFEYFETFSGTIDNIDGEMELIESRFNLLSTLLYDIDDVNIRREAGELSQNFSGYRQFLTSTNAKNYTERSKRHEVIGYGEMQIFFDSMEDYVRKLKSKSEQLMYWSRSIIMKLEQHWGIYLQEDFKNQVNEKS